MIVVVLLLLALCFFRKEGYTLSTLEETKLADIIKKYKVVKDDEKTIREALAAAPSKGSNPPSSFKDRLLIIANKYPGFAIEFQTSFGSQTGTVTMPKLTRSFGCDITSDNKFNCMFR